MNWAAAKRRMLIAEARSYLGVREDGENDGEFVRMFQSAVGRAQKESWCICFIQFCIKKIESLCENVFDHAMIDGNLDLLKSINPIAGVIETEHAVTFFKTSYRQYKVAQPGFIAVWKHKDSDSGHGGIVESVRDGAFTTIEGNTNEAGSREGDGVYRKKCTYGPRGNLILLGFVDPWP